MITSYFRSISKNLEELHNRLKEVEDPKSPFQRRIERTLYFTQYSFVLGYTALMMKLAFFNHYRGYNKLMKFSIVLFYQISIDPLTIFIGYVPIALGSSYLLKT